MIALLVEAALCMPRSRPVQAADAGFAARANRHRGGRPRTGRIG